MNFKACKLNTSNPVETWKNQVEKEKKIVEALQRVKEIRVVAPDTDLTLSTEKRRWIPTDAKKNMPGGEIFTAPVEGSVEGRIRFSFP